ncbi:MAG: glycosyltransferase family 39 protein [Candidatus Peribacteraceae bacterium]
MTERARTTLAFALFVTGLLWGVSTLLIYIGMPIHQYVYWVSAQVNAQNAACGVGGTFSELICRGTSAFSPFLWQTLRMMSPFYGYFAVSLLAFLGLLGWQGYKTGDFNVSMRLRPLTLVILFFASVWLIGTTLSFGSLYHLNAPENTRVTDTDGTTRLQSFRRFYEPKPSLYSGAGEEALLELNNNFQELMNSGCLSDTGMQTNGGARLFDLSPICMQGSMFARVGTQLVLVLFFLLTLLSVGRLVLVRALKLTTLSPLVCMVLSLGVGALTMVALLWLLTILGLLQSGAVWGMLALVHIVSFSQTRWWVKQGMDRQITVSLSVRSVGVFLAWMLISYLALNFLNVTRPFPIGWDDLGSYLNRPRLLSSYGSFIPSMSQFQWEYLTALGFLLFGYDSTVGAIFAMQINWAAGLIAVLTIFVFARMLLGSRAGLLSAILYYFLPMVGHFSFADMKIDNASFFTTALALLALLAALRPSDEEHESVSPRTQLSLLIVAGLIIGFSFAIKPTAILGALLLFTILTGWQLGNFGAVSIIFLGFALLQLLGPLDIEAILRRAELPLPISRMGFAVFMLVVGALPLCYSWVRDRARFMVWVQSTVLLLAGVAVASLPWMLYNGAIAGSFNLSTMLKAQDLTAPAVSYHLAGQEDFPEGVVVRSLPAELKVDPTHPACLGSSRVEELDRYWGFGTGYMHYLTLAWRQVMNADGFGYYVTFMPALLLFPLLLLLPYFWDKERRFLRLLIAGTWVFYVQWAFVGNGVSWYGIGMFLGLVVALEALCLHAPDRQNRWLYSVLIAMSIVVCLTNRMWQFDTQKNIFEYPLGKINAPALREVTIPEYDDIRESMVARSQSIPDRPYTYRIGTFISYFIPRNREIFPLADHQMQFFNCINQERDHALTLKRLQALGFNGIVFDTNTQTIEKDPNGPLHKKVESFANFVNDPALNMQIPINNPGNGIAYILLP